MTEAACNYMGRFSDVQKVRRSLGERVVSLLFLDPKPGVAGALPLMPVQRWKTGSQG